MASPTLAELQHDLATWVLDGRDVGLAHRVAVPPGVDVSTRLGIYSNGYSARLQEALLEAFPAVANILGDGSLASMLLRYCPQIPTGWCNLNYVGRALPNFLLSDRLAEELPFLPDLARLEWCVVECFHARVGEPFDLTNTASWELDDWASAQIAFQPGVALVSSPWPIHELRAARKRERFEIDVNLVGRPQSVWVYRQGFEVVTELLDEVEASIAQGLLEGRTLRDVMGQIEAEGADTGSVLDLFARFATLGLIAACHRASDGPSAPARA
jgi:hypothetical protein